MRPTGRQLGAGAPEALSRVRWFEADEYHGVLVRNLGDRIPVLRTAFKKRGRATVEEQAARHYLACILIGLDDPEANKAAARLLLRSDDAVALRRLGDARTRFRQATPEVRARTEAEVRAALKRRR